MEAHQKTVGGISPTSELTKKKSEKENAKGEVSNPFLRQVPKMYFKPFQKTKFCGSKCAEKVCSHQSCGRGARSSVKEIGSMNRIAQNTKGEVNEVRATPGWERVRIQIDSGAIDTVGPKEIAGAFKMRETEMSRRGIGFVAANGSGIKNYGEKMVVGYTDDGGAVSMKVHCADVKKVLCSVHKMNMGGNAVVLDGERSCSTSKAAGGPGSSTRTVSTTCTCGCQRGGRKCRRRRRRS